MPRCALCRMTTIRELLASLFMLLLSAMHAQVSSQPLRSDNNPPATGPIMPELCSCPCADAFQAPCMKSLDMCIILGI